MFVHVPGVTSKLAPPGQTFPFYDALAQAESGSDAKSKCGREACVSAKASILSTEALVEAVDLYATISELAGLDVPPTCPPDPFKVRQVQCSAKVNFIYNVCLCFVLRLVSCALKLSVARGTG